MKLCLVSDASVRRPDKDGANDVNEWLSNMPWPMWVGGKDGAHAIADCARNSSICVDVPLSTICTSWPVPKHFRLNFRLWLDPLRGDGRSFLKEFS